MDEELDYGLAEGYLEDYLEKEPEKLTEEEKELLAKKEKELLVTKEEKELLKDPKIKAFIIKFATFCLDSWIKYCNNASYD